MKIGKLTAQRIVTDLSEIIQENINLMDENSIIIASTDKQRVGTFHGGSREVIARNLRELVITNEKEYSGSLPGLNIPIEMDGKTIGVIGITGEYDKIEKYGKIIKRMTEILLLDDYMKEQKRLSSGARARFINEWIFSASYCDEPLFTQQGKALGIHVELTRKMIIFSPGELNDGDSLSQQRKLEKIEKCLVAGARIFDSALILNSGSKFIGLLPECTDKRLYDFAVEMKQKVEEECGIQLGVGLDYKVLSNREVHGAYKRAEKALMASLKTDGRKPIAYCDLTLEIFLPELSANTKREFVEKIFVNCSREETEQYTGLLKEYIECNGSINRMGERLFLHKNTIQYKLNKIQQKTGIDPRTSEGISLFYLALAFMGK